MGTITLQYNVVIEFESCGAETPDGFTVPTPVDEEEDG
jgi:hypothetical protein